ncbi:MAG: hypothetical protein J0M17_22190 [Planctomycetes bacterium]|nr:hypothetical protein [Planctomycetota bacterium]
MAKSKKRWVDQGALRRRLATFFKSNKRSLNTFGGTVNQTFEAFVFASAITWYRTRGWTVTFYNPGKKTKRNPGGEVHLKYSTNGRPSNYTFAECRKDRKVLEVRHQLRVSTNWYDGVSTPSASLMLDVAVIEKLDLSEFDSKTPVRNGHLITFAEAKHMSAFAELIAGFEGLVHELQPMRLTRLRAGAVSPDVENPAPFLYVSGTLNPSAEAILSTIRTRGYDIDVFNETDALNEAFQLPTIDPPATRRLLPRRAIDLADVPY